MLERLCTTFTFAVCLQLFVFSMTSRRRFVISFFVMEENSRKSEVIFAVYRKTSYSTSPLICKKLRSVDKLVFISYILIIISLSYNPEK